MSRLILLRHGQTEWNSAGRFQGTTDIDLDETGRRQADSAAKALAALQPDLVYTSDLRRARDTATPVADLAGLTVRCDPRLRERSYGPWEGLTRAQVKAQFPDEFADWEARRPFRLTGLEGRDEIAARGGAVLTDIAAELESDQTAVVVSHGGLLRPGMVAFMGWPDTVADSLVGLGNCCWADLRSGSVGWRMHGFNLSAHCE